MVRTYDVILDVYEDRTGTYRKSMVLKSFENLIEAEDFVRNLSIEEALELADMPNRRYCSLYESDNGDKFAIIFRNEDSIDVYVKKN